MVEYLNHSFIRPNTIQSRIYQQILFTEAVGSNTLVVLPTGMGKTVVIVMLIAYFLEKHSEQSILLIAPTRPLLDQHFETLHAMLNVEENSVILLSGSVPILEREQLWKKAKIVISTPQVLRNDIVSGFVDLKRVSLLCFDEAHHAVGDAAYVLPASEYLRRNPKGRIVGFTASPGKKEKLEEVIQNLGITNLQYMDEEDDRVRPYTHDVNQESEFVTLPAGFEHVLENLKAHAVSQLKLLKSLKFIESAQISRNSKNSILNLRGKIAKQKGKIDDSEFFDAMRAYGQLMQGLHAIELLETQGIKPLSAYFDKKNEELATGKKKSLARFLHDPLIEEVCKRVSDLDKQGVAHPKLTRLHSLVESAIHDDFDTRILIFTTYKATVDNIVQYLSDIKYASIHKFVGQSSTKYGKGLSQKEQQQVMEDFRSGQYNVLVSTSVGEEGLDVAQCDLVIFYDSPPSATRLIQRSGRTGRARAGKVIMLIAKGTRDEQYYYASRRQKKKIKAMMQAMQTEIKSSKPEKRKNLEDYLSRSQHQVVSQSSSQNDDISFTKQGRPIIYVDFREKGSSLMSHLLALDVDLRPRQLPVGDYILSSRVGVERKTVTDFGQTLIRQQLFDQLNLLKNAYSHPLLLIEGEQLYDSNIADNAIRGAIASISIDFGIPIIRTSSANDTANYLLLVAKREQEDKTRNPQITVPKHGDITELQLQFVSSIPSIDHVLARRLLSKFKTPRSLIEATEAELSSVRGIGQKKALRIVEFLQQEYTEHLVDET